MIFIFNGIFRLLKSIIFELVHGTVGLFDYVFQGMAWELLENYNFNLTLFSDTPIISMNMFELLSIVFTIFYSMFFIVLLYKATKKFINMVFGVFRV